MSAGVVAHGEYGDEESEFLQVASLLYREYRDLCRQGLPCAAGVGDGVLAREIRALIARRRRRESGRDARKGSNMQSKGDRTPAGERPATLYHAVLRGCRSESLVRGEADWHKMVAGIESMLFWCGGRVLGCRCESDRLELAVEPAHVPLGGMCRYVSVPYALHFNRVRGGRGQVFRPLKLYRLQQAFRTEFVLWLHRPLVAAGWSADAAYLDPRRAPWVDVAPVLDELGRGPGALRQYRTLRARGIDPDLAAAFAAPRDGLSHVHTAIRPALAIRKPRQRTVLRSVVRCVARHESVEPQELAGRSRLRQVCRARCLVTLVGVRCGVPATTIGTLLGRDASTLEESVLRLRARDSQGLSSAAATILAAVGTDEGESDSELRSTAPRAGEEEV